MKSIKSTVQYSVAFGTFWAMDCILIGYCSAFLQANGYSNTLIGIIVAAANLLSVVVQIVVANIADCSRKVNLFDLVIITAFVIMVAEVFILLLKGKSAIMFLAYTVATGFHLAHQSQLNAMNGVLAGRDLNADYGICRGIGSLCAAITSYSMGILITKSSISVLAICGELIMVIFLIGNVAMNVDYRKAAPVDEKQSKDIKDISMREFILRHKLFLIMSLGIFIMFYHQQVVNNFMLQVFQSTGGGTHELSIYFCVMPLLETIVLWCYSALKRFFSAKTLLKFSACMYIVRGLLMVLANSSLGIMLSLASHPFCHPLFLAAVVDYIDGIMDRKEAVRGQSLYVIVITASALIASLTGGAIIDAWGVSTLLFIAFICTIIGVAVILPMVNYAEAEAKNLF